MWFTKQSSCTDHALLNSKVSAYCDLHFYHHLQILLIVNLATTFTIDPHIDYTVFTILLLNSAINPILHVAVRKPVRKAYVEILKWFFYIILCCCDALKPTRKFGEWQSA